MQRTIIFFLLLFTSSSALAQFHAGIGGSLGTQMYQSSTDKVRLVAGADGLVEYRRMGVQVAGEWTNRSTGGRFSAYHLDATWRVPVADVVSLLIGAGATAIHLEAGGEHATTWNAEVELSRQWPTVELFGRLRHYSYSFQKFRSESVSPGGPAICAGVRLRIR